MSYAGGAWTIPPSSAPVLEAPPPTGSALIDQANIAYLANQTGGVYGGTVQLQNGAYAVSSSVRVDSVTNAGPTLNWTDASITNNDLGSYVIGPNVVGANGVQGRAPQIQTVNPGVGFTTDIAPGAAMAATSVWIVKPGVLLPEGVKIRGAGGIVSQGANFFSGTNAKYGTAIIDSGNGVSILTRGSNSYGARYGISDLVVWGGAGAWGGSGYTGNALGGLFVSNNSWWLEVDNVDFSYYKIFGVALDGNMNAQDFKNCSAQHIGTIGATTPTGGYLGYFFSGQVTSAGVNFYNCFAFNIYGMGWGGGPGGGPGGGSGLTGGFVLTGCQAANCNSTSFNFSDGYGFALRSSIASGKSSLTGCWSGTNGRGDLFFYDGAMTAQNCIFTSATATSVNCANANGTLNLEACDLWATSVNACLNSGVINWRGVILNGSATNLYAGGPTAAQCKGIGSSVGVALNATSYTSP